MLVDFSIENFRSINSQITLSMERIKLLREQSLDKSNIINLDKDNVELLKSGTLYGANASGKSNILQAFSYMKHLVSSSAKESQKGDPIPYEPFAFSKESKSNPTVIEVRFFINQKLYRYGFKVTEEEFFAEWLFENEKYLFLREKEAIDCSKRFEEGNGVEKRTRKNSLFLSVCAQWDGEISGEIIEKFFNKLNVLSNTKTGFPGFTAKLLEEKATRKLIIETLQAADVGITDVIASEKNLLEELENLPEDVQKMIKSKISNEDENLDDATINEIIIHHGDALNTLPLHEESEGTQKLFGMLGPIIDTIQNGEILIVDEFNDRLHPLLARALVKMYHSKVNDSAQLIFATHDTNMLSSEIFRRDQIWFTEKNRDLATDLYSLAEYKLPDGGKVRQDASYSKDYLRGRYGAIPYFGDFPFDCEDNE